MKAESSMLDQPATGLSEPTQAYCVALLSQEKSLGELQRHLHKTEALFRESVQRKNQQLDLLLAEVRRLSANAAGREAKASEHFESSLDAQRIELGRLRQQLATRETEVDALAAQVQQLRADLAEERTWREAAVERLESTAADRATLDAQRSELSARLSSSDCGRASTIERCTRQRRQSLRAAFGVAYASIFKHRMGQAEIEELRARLDGSEAARATERDSIHARLSDARTELEAEAESMRAESAAAKARASEAEADAEAEARERARLEADMGEAANMVVALQAQVKAHAQARESLAASADSAAAERSQLAIERDAALLERDGLVAERDSLEASVQQPESGGEALSSVEAMQAADGSGDGGAAAVSGASGEPAVVRLSLRGEPVVSYVLTIDAIVDSPRTTLQYVWRRAGEQRRLEGPSYLVTAPDIGCEISVLVTPVGSNGPLPSPKSHLSRGMDKQRHGCLVGALGAPQQAATAGAVCVAPEVPHTLREWVQRGERRFDGLFDATDRERSLLLTGDKIKVRENRNKVEKTVMKESHALARLEYGTDELTFMLVLPSVKRASPLTLRAKSAFQRDLIYLALKAFSSPDSIAALPTAATSLKPATALELNTPEPSGGC
ncbi:hypothetical protein EMIHUDRAFT_114270 [Emiliania huxleyi CCMP1516]|uniref:Uncharacterized protein n=4 Tax=Emiliania huxleyi TaxID=2903 RepID=A0A0D3JXJ8_EMIH1|nr:hypothetical protein EMIHUDRAFT_114270 [Emiliania huxleyi CCMP1516]EOD28233.1 hypothetical protein EMIHUDRAFT_114270 [Emiliania huxleyi CCMP1516]|eukprot:XP_005780662.1 hypothetical protein EMIHUDRAFT_114270 [Emiliania huxleyi CCMP1516]